MCFIYRLKRLEPFINTLEPITKAAENGDILLVTSIFTMAEVARVSDSATAEEQEQQIEDFFENDFIYPIPFDIAIHKQARHLVRLCNMKGKDAVHVASALTVQGLSTLQTYDDKVIKAYGKLLPQGQLRVETPEDWTPRTGEGTRSLFAPPKNANESSDETRT